MIDLSESKVYEFDEFRLDAKNHRLFRRASNELVPLTPKAVELLLVLIENKGRILTKDDLLERIWGDSIVEESNLSQTIFVLRKVLGENTKEPRFILTVPNRGYQFIAPVKDIYSEDKIEDEILEEGFLTDSEKPRVATFKSQISNPKSQIPNPKSLWLVAAALVLLAAFGVYWFYPTAKPATLREIKSVAVLPFKNIGGKTGDEYLGQGLSEVLTSKLSNIKTIIVRPTRSVMKYADASLDPKRIGSELNVEAVITGHVQKIDENIRVTVQLVRVSDDATLWAETFDDKFTNIFAVQDSISKQVTESLAIKLTTDEREQIAKNYTANAEAFRFYIQGRHFWNKRTPEDFLKAIEQFEKAARLDPNYALAYVGLANCYVLLPEYNLSNPHESFPKAKAAIKKALEIDDRLAEAYTALGYAQAFYDWDSAGAEQSFKRAIELNPNYATAHQWYAEFLSDVGRFDDAERHYERALEIDPLSLIIGSGLATLYYDKRETEKALAQAEKIIELDPNFAYGHLYKGYSYEYLKMDAETVECLTKSMTLFGEPPDVAEELKKAFGKNKSLKEFWQKRLEQIETRPHLKDYSAYGRAVIYVRTGDHEKALKWLNTAFERRDRFIHTAKNTPELDALRSDPRFQELLRGMGI